MDKQRIWAIVPVKTFRNAKQRLSPALSASARALLARTMLEDVLDALCLARGLAGVAVVTLDADARKLATSRGLRVIGDLPEEGHTAAVRGAARVLEAEGAGAIMTMPGDIPLVTGDEISTVVAAANRDRDFIIVPAHDRRGSNTILCTPPGAVPLQFGNDSFFPHLDSARAAGIEPTVLSLPGIGQDVDNPEDLHAIMASRSTARSVALLAGLLAEETPCN